MPNDTPHLFLEFPKVEPCGKIEVGLGTVIIAVAGFEERASACCKILEGNVFDALIVRYRPVDSRNDEAPIVTELRKRGVRLGINSFIEFARFSPDAFPSELLARLRALNAQRIILDVSGMSKLLMLFCLDVCREAGYSLTLFYAEARQYGPSEPEYLAATRDLHLQRPSIQIYTGVHGLIRHPRFSSVAMQGEPAAAIAFMSFNEQLTQAL